MKVRVLSASVAPHDNGRSSAERDSQRKRWNDLRGKVLDVTPTQLESHCRGRCFVLTPEQASALGLCAGEWVLCEHEATPVED